MYKLKMKFYVAINYYAFLYFNILEIEKEKMSAENTLTIEQAKGSLSILFLNKLQL